MSAACSPEHQDLARDVLIYRGGGDDENHPPQILGNPRDPELSHPHERGGGGLLDSHPASQPAIEAVHKTAAGEICAHQTSNAPVEHSRCQLRRAHTHTLFSYCALKWRLQQTVGEKETLTKPTHPPQYISGVNPSAPMHQETSHPHETGAGG